MQATRFESYSGPQTITTANILRVLTRNPGSPRPALKPETILSRLMGFPRGDTSEAFSPAKERHYNRLWFLLQSMTKKGLLEKVFATGESNEMNSLWTHYRKVVQKPRSKKQAA